MPDFFSLVRKMDKFRFFILLIFALPAIMLCNCGGGGGGGGNEGNVGGGDTSGSINLAWEASSDSSVVGHMVYYGTRSGSYEYSADAGATPGPSVTIFHTLQGLSKEQAYYIAVTAYDSYRNESDFSNEVSAIAR